MNELTPAQKAKLTRAEKKADAIKEAKCQPTYNAWAEALNKFVPGRDNDIDKIEQDYAARIKQLEDERDSKIADRMAQFNLDMQPTQIAKDTVWQVAWKEYAATIKLVKEGN